MTVIALHAFSADFAHFLTPGAAGTEALHGIGQSLAVHRRHAVPCRAEGVAGCALQQLAAQGKGVILISSELPELLGISDRIYTIFEGQITDDLPVSEATPENLMRSMTSVRQKAQR